jgi:hypothetical protein
MAASRTALQRHQFDFRIPLISAMLVVNTTKELDGNGKKSVLDAHLILGFRIGIRLLKQAEYSPRKTTNPQQQTIEIGYKKSTNGRIKRFSSAAKF